jgi:ubiquitin-conjugating enzyme E2 G1
LKTELAKNPPEGVSVGLGEDDNMFVWELMLIGPQDTLYEGGFFTAKLEFPQDFPNSPPVMTFLTPMWHPNGKNQIVQYYECRIVLKNMYYYHY